MAWQSTLDRARSLHLDRTTVIGLIAGIGVGLALGLLIGWVWWPVEWQGPETVAAPVAGTTTGSQFEAPEAKALYLGAVADAFVYASAAGQADAGAAAAQRLAALGGDMRLAFNNAIDFYSAQAGSATQVANLTTLASALGIPLTGAAVTDGNQAAGQATQSAAAAPASQAGIATADNAGNNVSGSGNWLLVLFTALLLIAGGVYILWILRRRQAAGEGGDGFAEEEPAPAAASSTAAFERSTLSPVRSGLTPAAAIRSSVERPQPMQAGAPHGFDAEEMDEYDETEYESADEAEDEIAARLRYRAGEGEADGALDAEEEGDDGWGDEAGDDEDVDRPAAPPPGFVTSVGAAPPYSGARSSSPSEERQGAADAGANAAAASAPRTPPATLQPPTPSRFARYTPVQSYTATYFVGHTDFDHTQNIENGGDGKYIGEYGIGIPPSLGLLHDDLNKAIAIDIYLFDKTDERQPVTVKRSLLSLYADDHKRTEFERDKQSQPPIVAQPNTNFQLEGVQLLLDCLIKQVDYTPEGYFKNVTVELVLKRKS